MNLNHQNKKIAFVTIIIGVLVFSLFYTNLFAETRSSASYKIQSDSINFAGGLATSTNYREESTVGEIATGDSMSANYNLHAGYQQMQEVYLAVTAASDVVMSPAIGGVAGGAGVGSTSFTATTDNPAGYQVTIKASSSPALVYGANSFADYTRAGANPDYTFALDSTSDSEFGFTPEGDDIAQEFKNSGSTCNTGTTDTPNACWSGLSTSPITIVYRTSGNHPSGVLTTIKFMAEAGSNRLQPLGVYTATTTLTTTAL